MRLIGSVMALFIKISVLNSRAIRAWAQAGVIVRSVLGQDTLGGGGW